MAIQEKVQEIICEIEKENGEEQGNRDLINAKLDTPLYGVQGCLDSISLVRLTADLEEEVFNNFNKEIIIADESALSQKFSPFQSVASLTDYVVKLINEIDE